MKQINFTEEEFLEAVKNSKNYTDISKKIGISRYAVKKYINKHDIDISHFDKPNRIVFTEQDFLNAISNSKTLSEAHLKLGYKSSHSISLNKNTIRQTLFYTLFNKLKPDISHFTNQSVGRFELSNTNKINHAVKILFNKYKYSTIKSNNRKNRGIKFEINFSEFFKLVTSQRCFYCGDGPKNKISNTGISLHGIDRLNNDDSYKIDNCVTCCSKCNYIKYIYSNDVFLKQIVKIKINHENLFLD